MFGQPTYYSWNQRRRRVRIWARVCALGATVASIAMPWRWDDAVGGVFDEPGAGDGRRGPTVTITYSRNCDGGGQEFTTAKNAVLAAVPTANVVANRTTAYPIWVEIKSDDDVIWANRQQELFRKNPGARLESIREITAATKKLLG